MLIILEPKLNEPAGVVVGAAAFGINANGAAAVVFAGSAVLAEKLKGVVLATWDAATGAELEAAPN